MPLQAAHTAAPLLHCSSPTAAAAVTAAAAAASCHVRCTTFLPLQAALTLLCCHGLRLAVSPQLLLLLPLLLLCRFVCRTIVCTAYLPSPGLEPAPTPLALANQHYPAKQGLFPGSKPSQDSLAASLSIVRTLVHSSDEDPRQTGRIHPDCPCPPIAGLQS